MAKELEEQEHNMVDTAIAMDYGASSVDDAGNFMYGDDGEEDPVRMNAMISSLSAEEGCSWPVINDVSAVSSHSHYGNMGRAVYKRERRSQRDRGGAASSATAALAQRKDFATATASESISSVCKRVNAMKLMDAAEANEAHSGANSSSSHCGRQTSWSDESGQSLCEYFDETSSKVRWLIGDHLFIVDQCSWPVSHRYQCHD